MVYINSLRYSNSFKNINSLSNYKINKFPIMKLQSNNATALYNPILGSNLGIPLNILQFIFTTNYYNENIVNFELILLQIAIGIFTYGSDRLFDAYNYNISVTNNDKNILTSYSDDKINYYQYLLKNYNINLGIIFLSYFYIISLLIQDNETFPIIALLTSTLYYKDFKINFGQFKALYIGLFWTLGCVILPCVLHDHNYEILNHPLNYIPCFLTMFGSSNLLDIKDIKEDKAENIYTLPVIFGSTNSIFISHLSILISSILFAYTDNFNNNIWLSSIYELQNFGIFFANYNYTIN